MRPGASRRPSVAARDAVATTAPDFAVLWHGPVFGASGYADESRQLVLGLDSAGVRVRIAPLASTDARLAIPQDEAGRLRTLASASRSSGAPWINVFHSSPWDLSRVAGADYHIGRTMFECERLPSRWAAACERMDEIWVPSKFNVESFARSGVSRHKLVHIPESIDVERFPRPVRPLPIRGTRRFNFLSVFQWQPRKGWDVLLRAFVEEFRPDEPVTLVLKAWPANLQTMADVRQQARALLARHGLGRELPPHVLFYEPFLHSAELPRFYAAGQAFVLPTRGEGWGRPFMEAMLMELPVIATRWGGQLDFLSEENAHLVDCRVKEVSAPAAEEIPILRGQKWAEPSLSDLRRRMRELVEEGPDRRKVQAARETIVAQYSRERIASQMVRRLGEIADRLGRRRADRRPARRALPRADRSGYPAVAWEGPAFGYHSLALVNRELARALMDAGCEITLQTSPFAAPATAREPRWARLAPRCHALLSRPADFTVFQEWPPRLIPPAQGRWVILQPWELGSLPKRWLQAFRDADEVWAPSRHVREGYVEAGVPADRVAVVPNGVDGRRFQPRGARLDLGAPAAFRFLYVGGTLYRKGIDLLLAAYRMAFQRSDDVCLVIKDLGGDSFYKGMTHRRYIRELLRRRTGPRIAYSEAVLPDADMPALYRACDVLVLPYRGEGFGLPILEAMACGVPAIATGGGACLDYCREDNSLLVRARKTRLSRKALGEFETVGSPWWYEPDVADLAEKMRHAYDHAAAMKAMGRKASDEIRAGWTWQAAARKALARFRSLAERPDRASVRARWPGARRERG